MEPYVSPRRRLWLPGETLTLDPNTGLGGVDQIRIVTEHGVAASESI